MKSFWIGAALGFILGAGLTFLYFSLATLFSAHSKLAAEAADRTAKLSGLHDLDGEPSSRNAKGVGA
jgi:hypothetical protein